MEDKKWHAQSVQEVIEITGSSPDGLSEAKAQRRLEENGKNEIPEQNGEGPFRIFLNQFRNPLILILIGAALISLVLNDALDAVIIAVAVLLNAGIGFFQELKVSHVLRQLMSTLQYRATVIRDGAQKVIDSRLVAFGDVLVLRQGDKIPADGRLIKVSDLKTNEAVLTGESFPEEKSVEPLSADTSVADRTNMAFMGTFVEEGTGLVLVTAIGAGTEFGKIADLIRRERAGDITPLQAKLNRLARLMGIVFVGLAVLLFLFGIASGRDPLSMFLTAVATAVAAVPESMPVALGVILAIGARRILAKGGLVRKMSAAEALGGTTVIASDKTATLTEGKMHVAALVLNDRREVAGELFPQIVERDSGDPEHELMKWLALASNATVENPADPVRQWKIRGLPLDRALTMTMALAGVDRDRLRIRMPRLDELPFDSKYKYSAALHRFSDTENIIILLGAPEVVLAVSRSSEKQWFSDKTDELAGQGLRILGVAFKKVPASAAMLEREQVKGFDFAGLVVLSDPVRPEAAEAIRVAKEAGIRTIMVTGDHARTAEYVARQVGITDDPRRVIEAKDAPGDLVDAVARYDVFARVSPEDKVRIVDALSKRGESVAVLGDGINDAPALLRADIGVAVGSGTDVAKEASDLVLLNDSFKIIVEAIRQGRIIIDNIKKVLIFLVSDAFSEIFLIATSILFKLPLPLLPAQILWVNIIEDGLPAIALAFERGEAGIMKRKPEEYARIFAPEMKWLIGMFAVITNLALLGLFYYSLKQTGDEDYSRTMAFCGLGVTSLLYVFSVRSLRKPFWKINIFSNPLVLAGTVLGIVLYLAALYLPLLQGVLKTVPLGLYDWSLIAALSIFNVAAIELGKFIFLRSQFKKISDKVSTSAI